ncbi:MAG: mercury methylation corrinoid protein HgcA [bacterium]|nr:mercury methylation corrinoid protein HgcA [bacterium]
MPAPECSSCGAVAPRTANCGMPVVSVNSTWSWRDWLGAARVRLNLGRMCYAVTPGLYAIGRPAPDAPVLVTANYKLTFDHVRRAMHGMAGWLLVLDTKGINVWCAAGKGTFGTDELIRAVAATGLAHVVTHRTLIVPQLGAPGVAAHLVQQQTGFRVVYGPVRATDLPAFLAAGMQATPAMRRVTFDLRDRLLVVPVELAMWIKYAVLLALLLALLSGVHGMGYDLAWVCSRGLRAAGLVLLGFVVGGAVTPALLPWLPGRAFAVKGALTGIVVALLCWALGLVQTGSEVLAATLLLGAMASFMGLQFTGASTFTSLSGVRKETRIALPLQSAALLAGIIIWLVAR